MITFVTSNVHKFNEVSALFLKAGIEVQWKKVEYEEIQADTTEEVSLDSCRKIEGMLKGDFFIEDTGLFIDALNGFPGVYSSYVQKTIGNEGIIRLMAGKSPEAFFKTVITARLGSETRQYTGVVRGSISAEEKGRDGFGYDPIFIPEGSGKTLSEMGMEEKNRISHRSMAVGKFISDLSGTRKDPKIL